MLNTLWSDVYLIRNGVAITAANASTYGAAAIQTAIGPDGTSEKILALNLTNSGGAYNAQLDVGFNRITDGAGLASPDLSHYIRAIILRDQPHCYQDYQSDSLQRSLHFKTGGHPTHLKAISG